MNESPSQPLDRDEMNLYSPRLFEATKTKAAPAPPPPHPRFRPGGPLSSAGSIRLNDYRP
jgi:hypothetical protein